MKSRLLLGVLSSLMITFVYGQTPGSYRSKQSGNWNQTTTWERFDGTNWANATVVPSSSDEVISVTSTHQVTVTDTRTVDQLFVDPGANLTVTGTITINDGVATDLTVQGTLNHSGTLNGNGLVLVTGSVNWTNGIVAANVNLTSSATMTLSGPTLKTIDTKTITNQGTINWTGGQLVFAGGKLQNENVFNQSVDQPFADPAATGFFTNTATGIFTKSAGTGITEVNTHVNNAGVININSGTISFNRGTTNNGTINAAGGTTFQNSGSFNDEGIINIASAVTFNNTAGSFVQNGLINFSGTITINNAATWWVNVAQVLSSTVTLNHSGKFDGTSTLTVNGLMNWTNGTTACNLTLTSTANMTLSGSTLKTIETKTIINQGTINLIGGQLVFLSGKLQNESVFNQSVDQPLADPAGTGLFTNTSTGIFTKSAGAGITEVNTHVNNAGIININSGTLAFNRSTAHSGTINTVSGTTFKNTSTFTDNGTINIVSGALFTNEGFAIFTQNNLINFSGTVNINNNATWNVNVLQVLNSTTSFYHSGTLGGNSTLTVNGPMTWAAGTVRVNLKLNPTATLTVSTANLKSIDSKTIINQGIINWTGGQLVFASGTLQNENAFNQSVDEQFADPAGTGLFNNTTTGIFTKSGSGVTNVNTHVTNAGAIKGIGTLAFNRSFTNTGITAPGLSPGVLTINNQQPFSLSSTLSIEINGNGGAGQPTGHDQLQRNGNLTLSGMLTVSETGVVPGGDYTIISLTSGTISGTFGTTNLPAGYTIIYNSNNVVARKAAATCLPTVSITIVPSNTICPGSLVSFSAAATNGGATPSFQWKLNGNNVGTNSNIYSNNALVNGDQVSVEMTSSAACASPTTATSNTITMTVNTPVATAVSISANPGNTICAEATVTFTATPTNGGSTPSYQWKVNGNNVGTNSNTYSSTSLVNGDLVACLMTSSTACASPATAVSNVITMSVTGIVTPSVNISANPGNQVCAGTPVTFTATPTNGGAIPSYQWKLNGNNVGTNSNTYSTNTLVTGDVVSCVMSTSLACTSQASAQSNSILMLTLISVVPSVSILANTGNTVCTGTPVTFTATPINGGATPSYQWRLNGNNVGTNSNTYSNNALANNDMVSCVMTSSIACASPTTATSSTITMSVTTTVVPSVNISTSPGAICAGRLVTFFSTTMNSGTPTYQWKLNGNNVGTNSSTYSTNTLVTGDQVSCEITSSLACASPNTATSNTISIFVTEPVTPSISIAAVPGNIICAGTPVTFTATSINGGAVPLYQWKINGNTVLSTNINTYSNSALADDDVVSCLMASSATCATPGLVNSNNIAMTVNPVVVPLVSISASPGNVVCEGTTVTFTATPTNGGANPSYQWRVNGVSVGINSSTYSSNALESDQEISCTMTSSMACASPITGKSNIIEMVVNAPTIPLVNISANPGNTVCAGTNVTFTAAPTNGGTTPTYQWKLNGNNVGTNSNTYSNNALANGDQVNVVMTSSAGCDGELPVTSNTIVMSITSGNINVSIVVIGNRNRCPLTLQANPGGDVSYQWYKHGIPILGATDRRYVANGNGSYSVRVTRNGCSAMSSLTEVVTCPSLQTGINTNREFIREELPLARQVEIQLYPNPANDYVTVELGQIEKVNGEATVQLVTLQGRVLLTQRSQLVKGQINCRLKLDARWKDQLYIVKVIVNDKIYTGKLIKIKP